MAIDLDVHGNTQPLEAAVQAAVNRIRRKPIKITVDDKGATQPLGNMKRAADEFGKSMEAANARILAFGASMAIINGVADAFKGMVRNLVDVEKSLADINVVMGLTSQNLDKFSDGLFKVAKETGAAFRVAADAATEYARQGLAVEETLKRTRDALILTRLTGMDSAEAVKSLTAAMNTYGKQIKDTTQLVSKFAAVDVQFAVSAEDFAAAISRTGQAAKSAGVDIDELIGIVTSAQQQTARGGAVIGNALKTIFTKTGRTDTLNQLENLGIAVRDLEGNTIGAKRILTDLANSFDHLSEAQKAQIAQTMGGLFHINILKAVLSDAAKQNGILAKATQISSSATDEAIQKNEQLRNTMAAMAGETGNAIKELSVQIGELMLAPGMEKILNTVKSIAEGASDILGDGESVGSKFANGFLKGVGNVITGPGLVVLTTVFVKLFMTAAKFTSESLKSLIGVTTEAQKQKAIQTSLVALIGQNAALGKEMLRTDISRTEKEKILLGLLQAQTAEANKLNAISKQLASTLYTRGYGPGLTTGKRRAYGHIPNYADPERAQAARGGYAAGSIRTMNMPGQGSVIYNSAEKVKNFAGFKQPAIMPPQSSKAGKNYQQAFGSIHGFDPYAAGGYIPNYAKTAAEYLESARKAKTTANLTKIARGHEIGGKTFSEAQRNAAALAIKERTAQNKPTLSHSSDIKNKPKVTPPSGLSNIPLDLNQIPLTKSKVKDMGVLLGYGEEGLSYPKYSQTFGSLPKDAREKLLPYMSDRKKDVRNLSSKEKRKEAYGKKNKMPDEKSPHWKRKVTVTLPTKAVYAVSEDDVERMKKVAGADTLQAALKRSIGPGFDKFSSKIGQKLFGSKSKGTNVLEKHVLSDGSALGALFEAGVRGALNNEELTGAEQQRAFDFMGDNAQRLSDKFMGIGKRYYIEAKKDLSAASKGDIPKKVLNAAAAFIGPMKPGAAGGYIPNFAANSWESEPKWKWSMNPDYIAFQKKKNQEELNKRISKFGNSNISLTGKYSGNLPIARITDPQTGTYTDFTYGKGSGEAGNSASIIYSSRGKKDQKGGAFRNFGILGDFTSKQGGKDRSIYSDFDQINVAAGKSPWAMVLRAFPQLKQRIKPGMVTSGEMNIGYDTLPFNSLRSLKMQVSKWVKQNGLQAFLDYSKANLGFNEKNAILGGTSSGDLFSIGGLRTRMLTRKDKNYLNDSKVGFAASGYVPNFADPLSDAIGREKAAGVPVSQIRVGSHGALINRDNPLGLGVTNTYDEPNGLRDVFGANGFVPNYANKISDTLFGKKDTQLSALDTEIKTLTVSIDGLDASLRRGKLTGDNLAQTTAKRDALEKRLTVTQEKRERLLASVAPKSGGIIGSMSALNKRMENTAFGRSMSGMGGMGIMMGAPMLAGMLPGADDPRSSMSSVSGALQGASTGASIGMMFGPLGTAIGGAVGALGGFISATINSSEALEKEAAQRSKTQQQSIVSTAIPFIQQKELHKKASSFLYRGGQGKIEEMGLGPDATAMELFKRSTEIIGGSAPGNKSSAQLMQRAVMEEFLKNETKSKYELNIGRQGESKEDTILKDLTKEEYLDLIASKGSLGEIERKDAKTGEARMYRLSDVAKEKAMEDIGRQMEDLNDNYQKENDAVILRLNIQKAINQAQHASKLNLLHINEKHAGVIQQLDLQQKFLGSSITEQQQLDFQYKKAIESAKQKYQSTEASAESAFRVSMLGFGEKDNVVSRLKTKLAGGDEEQAKKMSTIDLTERLAALNNKELQAMLEGLDLTEKERGELELIIKARTRIGEIASTELDTAKQRANTEKNISSYFVKRNDLMKKAQRDFSSEKSESEYQQSIRAMGQEVSAARRKARFGDGYKTPRQRADFAMQEAEINAQIKIRNLLENESINKKEKMIQLNSLRADQQKMEALQEKEKNGTIETEEKNTLKILELDTQRLEKIDLTSREIERQSNLTSAQIENIKTLLEIEKQSTEEQTKKAEALERLNVLQKEMQYSQAARSRNLEISQAEADLALGPGYVSGFDRSQFELSKRAMALPSQTETIKENAELEKEKLKLDKDYQKYKDVKDKFDAGGIWSKQDFDNYTGALEVLEEIEQETDLINKNRDEAIAKEEKLLLLAEQRLAKEIAHKTGPGAFGRGLGDGFERMREQAELFDYEFSQKIPNEFANALADAMSQGLSGAKDIDDALRDAGIGFLQMIQKAMMQKAAMNIVGMLPFSQGGNVRKYSQGGSVPAMVSNGEYVMSREAVNKYGGSFMHSLNSGGRIPGFNQGGKLEGFNYKSGRAYQKKKMSGFFYSQSGNVGLEQDAGMLQEALDEKRQKEEEAVAKEKERAARRNARIKQIIGTVAGSLASSLISSGADWAAEKGVLGKTAQNKAILKKAGVSGTAYDKLASQVGGDSATKLLMSVSDPTSANYQASRTILDQIQLAEFDEFQSRYFKKKQFASGGYISGTPGIDQIPAMLSEGEYVIRASSARQIGKPMLDQINAGRFNQGGPVEAIKEDQDTSSSSGNTNNINISVNIEAGSKSSKSENSENSSSNQNDQDQSQQSFALGEKIKEQVLAVIIDEQRPGGVLS